jgi:extradiol dioxygenase family protein
MADAPIIFHLAIPCRDLDEASAFYLDRLGCRLARRYDDRITLEFFGHQVVCHLAPEAVDAQPRPYPRHFGVTFRDRADFDRTLARARTGGADFFTQPSVRFAGRREAHATFFLRDPSNNLIEFKHYDDAAMMY